MAVMDACLPSSLFFISPTSTNPPPQPLLVMMWMGFPLPGLSCRDGLVGEGRQLSQLHCMEFEAFLWLITEHPWILRYQFIFNLKH